MRVEGGEVRVEGGKGEVEGILASLLSTKTCYHVPSWFTLIIPQATTSISIIH